MAANGAIAAYLVFVIQERQHSVYERDKNDLILNQEITLLDALTGGRTLEYLTLRSSPPWTEGI